MIYMTGNTLTMSSFECNYNLFINQEFPGIPFDYTNPSNWFQIIN